MSKIMVKVKYFAALREQLGRNAERIEVEEQISVGELWAQLCGNRGGDRAAAEPVALWALPVQVLAAVNCEHAPADRRLCAGDEIAFFPPVTGG